MLSVFKLVSCKPGASRELALRPQGLRSLKNVLNYSFVIDVILIGTHLILLFYE